MRVQDIIAEKDVSADPKIVAKFADISDSQRSYYINKWAEEKGIDSDEAMQLAGYKRGSYMGAGSYMWDYDPNESIEEAPVGLLKQVGRKLGAKAAGAIGMKGTAAKLSGAADTGDEARQLSVALKGYAGQTGINLKQMQGPQLAAFLKSKGYPNMHLKGVDGIMTPKQMDQAILTAVQDAKKAGGDPTTGTSSAPAQPSAPTAGAASGQQGGQGTNVAGKPTSPQVDKNKDGKDDKTGEPMGAVDANKDGKDDNTGKVIPMPTKGQAAASGAAGAGTIPADIQKQLDALTPTEKKVLAGAL